MTDTDPVEAVARALCYNDGLNPDGDTIQHWNGNDHVCWEDFKGDAYAAIAAYREALEASGWQVVPKAPDDNQKAEGGMAGRWLKDDFEADMDRAADVYNAMLSAAPKPTE